MTEPKATPRRAVRLLIFLLVAVVAIAGFWWAYHNRPAEGQGQARKGLMPPVAVAVETVRKQDVAVQLSALGTVTSANTVTVHSRVDGQLDKIYFSEGALVEQNQLLAELDSRPYQATLTQTQGQLLRDQALLKNARLDLVRYKQLLEQDSIAAQQVDTQKALIEQYEGIVKLDQGLVENAQLQLSYSRIVAPTSGRVGLRQVDPGNIVHANDSTGLVIITQIQPIDLVFAIPEASLGQVLQAKAAASELKVEAWDRDRSNLLAEGTLLAIDNQLNTGTGTVALKARFSNEQQRLFPNQFVNVILQLGKQTDAITVPTAAVQLGKEGKYVYTVNDDQTVRLTRVTTGIISGHETVVSNGLLPDQKVAVDGLDKLRDTIKIAVIEPGASTTTDKGPQSARDKSGGNTKKRNSSSGQ
jgi:membrane fusion protein, multidrug efflux system